MGASLTGQDFHGFILGERMYEGGFGEIYKATSPDGQTEAAVKVIRSQLTQDENSRKRFMREIELLQTVKHPHIIPIITFGYKNNHYYLIMPYIQGKDLNDLLAVRQFTPQDTGVFVEQIAQALHQGHQYNIIHRDLKPENILVELDGTRIVKYYLSDFGLAKRPGTDTNLTAQGKVLGTPEYLSPEYILDRDGLDGRSDLYSLAIMTYELLLGMVPFGTGTYYDIISAHTRLPVPPPRHLNPLFPVALETLVLRDLEKNPEARHSTTIEFANAFQETLSQLTEQEQQTCYWV